MTLSLHAKPYGPIAIGFLFATTHTSMAPRSIGFLFSKRDPHGSRATLPYGPRAIVMLLATPWTPLTCKKKLHVPRAIGVFLLLCRHFLLAK